MNMLLICGVFFSLLLLLECKVIEIPIYQNKLENNITTTGEYHFLRKRRDVDLYNDLNVAYYGIIDVGGQDIKVLFDTGSSYTWFPSVDCETESCQSSSYLYDHDLSTTYEESEISIGFDFEYGSGTVSGIFSSDLVSIPDTFSSSIRYDFGEGTDENMEALEITVGIVGLGYPGLVDETYTDTDTEVKPLLDVFYEEKILEEYVFSFYFNDYPASYTSKLYIGGYPDESLYDGELHVVDVEDTPGLGELGFWMVELGPTFLVGGEAYSSPDSMAVIDSGTSLILVPESFIDPVFDQLMPTEDCQIDHLPDFEIYIDGVKYTFTPDDYVIFVTNYCMLGIAKNSVGGTGSYNWVLGQVFLRKYFTIFDRENDQMSFATSAEIDRTPRSVWMVIAIFVVVIGVMCVCLGSLIGFLIVFNAMEWAKDWNLQEFQEQQDTTNPYRRVGWGGGGYN